MMKEKFISIKKMITFPPYNGPDNQAGKVLAAVQNNDLAELEKLSTWLKKNINTLYEGTDIIHDDTTSEIYTHIENLTVQSPLLHLAIVSQASEAVIKQLFVLGANPNLFYKYTYNNYETRSDRYSSTVEILQNNSEQADYTALDLVFVYGKENWVSILLKHNATLSQLKSRYQEKLKLLQEEYNHRKKYKSRLFLGEGDFGYVRSLVEKHAQDKPGLGKAITATEYMSEEELKKRFANDPHSKFVENITYLKQQHVTILFNIDATKLKSHFPNARFKRIHFCCPYSGIDTDLLIENFFKSAREIQQEKDRIHIILAGENNSTWWQGEIYKIVEAVTKNGYFLLKRGKFEAHNFTHYVHRQNYRAQSAPAAANAGEYVLEKRAIMPNMQEAIKANQAEWVRLLSKNKMVTAFSTSIPYDLSSSQYSDSSQSVGSPFKMPHSIFSSDGTGDNFIMAHEEKSQQKEIDALKKQLENLEKEKEFLFEYTAEKLKVKPDEVKQGFNETLKRKRENEEKFPPVAKYLATEKKYVELSKLAENMGIFNEITVAQTNKKLAKIQQRIPVAAEEKNYFSEKKVSNLNFTQQ